MRNISQGQHHGGLQLQPCMCACCGQTPRLLLIVPGGHHRQLPLRTATELPSPTRWLCLRQWTGGGAGSGSRRWNDAAAHLKPAARARRRPELHTKSATRFQSRRAGPKLERIKARLAMASKRHDLRVRPLQQHVAGVELLLPPASTATASRVEATGPGQIAINRCGVDGNASIPRHLI